MNVTTETRGIDKANAEFWNELCGTTMARIVGITDHSLESLKRFDAAYLAFYPYLLRYVTPSAWVGKRVLEVGLGYGTVGQQLAAAGALYTGLDIARGPVAMMSHRLALQGLAGAAVRGSMLDCPLRSESVDAVISIGCFHHTGDVQRCLDETWRVLKPGGTAVLMVYNQLSYRQWGKWPRATLHALMHDYGLRRTPSTVHEDQRAAYDANSAGEGAAETAFFSIRRLSRMLLQFSRTSLRKENCGSSLSLSGSIPLAGDRLGASFGLEIPRRWMLSTLGRRWGLDLYVRATK
jgi:SAM-dependent methyltransferase